MLRKLADRIEAGEVLYSPPIDLEGTPRGLQPRPLSEGSLALSGLGIALRRDRDRSAKLDMPSSRSATISQRAVATPIGFGAAVDRKTESRCCSGPVRVLDRCCSGTKAPPSVHLSTRQSRFGAVHRCCSGTPILPLPMPRSGESGNRVPLRNNSLSRGKLSQVSFERLWGV